MWVIKSANRESIQQPNEIIQVRINGGVGQSSKKALRSGGTNGTIFKKEFKIFSQVLDSVGDSVEIKQGLLGWGLGVRNIFCLVWLLRQNEGALGRKNKEFSYGHYVLVTY